MVTVTMIGSVLAKEGVEFVSLGPQEECRVCKFKQACQQLEKGTRYRITGLRDKEHDCPIHHEGRVRVVEVESISLPLHLPKEKLVKGATVTYSPEPCDVLDCPYRMLCFPLAVDVPVKVHVEEILPEAVDCASGRRLVKTYVTKAP